ncbi:uncharacterized protein [Montipora foliosa]|uniref:uncharacterized protein isoform X1 n=1 Tax=Montipora foliosa TaxID=591990 RepID=UPI0035F200A6
MIPLSFYNQAREAKKMSGTSNPILNAAAGDRPFKTLVVNRESSDQRATGQEDLNRLRTCSKEQTGKSLGDYHSTVRRALTKETRLVNPPPWAACAKTLQRLLEQYMDDHNSMSPLEGGVLDGDTLQSMVTEKGQKNVDQVTSRAPTPPPLVNRPSKRLPEQSQMTDIIHSQSKRPKWENYRGDDMTNPLRSLFKGNADFREEMFEKTKSLENTLKQLRPPPPLLKKGPRNKTNEDLQRTSQGNNVSVAWEGHEQKVGRELLRGKKETANITNVSGRDSEQRETLSTKERSSHISPDCKSEPVPRQITEGDHKSSCGGYAFDHTSMPKIVAVHSISKYAEDEDEWERNKAFISKVKALEEGRKKLVQTALAQTNSNPHKTRDSTFQLVRVSKEVDKLSNVNDSGVVQEEVSFERYVLYHLLSEHNGNVEQVRRVLRQTLIQEWLSYCNGDVDPKLQIFNGVNFHELRELYERWCQLQRDSKKNHFSEGKIPDICNSENMIGSNNIQRLLDSKNVEKQFRGTWSSQRSLNSQHHEEARLGFKGGNCSTNSNLNLDTRISRIPINSLHTSPSFQERERNSFVAETTNKNNRTGTSFTQLSTPQNSSQSRPLSHFANVNRNILTMNSDASRESSGFQHVSGGFHMSPAEHAPGQEFCRSREQVVGECSAEGSDCMQHQSKIVIQEQERADGTNTASVTLLHISQTNTKQGCEKNTCTDLECRAVQSKHQIKHNRPESQSKHNVRCQEDKGTYLWRFKNGKLISDSMPCIKDGEVIREFDMQNLFSGQRKITETTQTPLKAKTGTSTSEPQPQSQTLSSLNDRSCQIKGGQTPHNIQAIQEQHKKVCGAATCGKPCFCVLGTRFGQQRAETEKSSIQRLQQLVDKPTNKSHVIPTQDQRPYKDVQDLRRHSFTPSVPSKEQDFPLSNKQRNDQNIQTYHASFTARDVQPFAGLETFPNANGKEIHANRQGVSHARETWFSSVGAESLSNHTKSKQPLFADHGSHCKKKADERPSAVTNTETHMQLAESRNLCSSVLRHHPLIACMDTSNSEKDDRASCGTQKKYGNESAYSNANAQKNQFQSRFNPSSNAQSTEPSFPGLYHSRSQDPNQESTHYPKALSNAQKRDFLIFKDNTETLHAQPNHTAGLFIKSTTQTNQRPENFNGPFQDSQRVKSNQQANTGLNSFLTAFPNRLNIHTSISLQDNSQSVSMSRISQPRAKEHANACVKAEISANASLQSKSGSDIPPSSNEQVNRQWDPISYSQHYTQMANQNPSINLKTLLSGQHDQESTPSSLDSSKRQLPQPTESTVSNQFEAQARKQAITNTTEKVGENAYVSIHILQPPSTLVKVASKVDATSTPTPELNASSNHSADSRRSMKCTSVKSEKRKDTQCRYATPVPPKKASSSLKQLAKKVIETRKRHEMENIPWKKKILKSLEAVLMKRLRKTEKDTGIKADLEDGIAAEKEKNVNDKK